jgi:hypothetical protein
LFATVSKAQFQIAYEGSALRAGAMDVNELAPSLLAIGDLFQEANRQLNGDNARLSVRVKSDFKKGSFEVALVVDQSLLEQAKSLLIQNNLSTAPQILGLLFGTGFAAKGLFSSIGSAIDLWKKCKGEKPKTIIEDPVKGITILQFGDGNQVNVDPKLAVLYGDDKIRASLTGAVQPVAKPGIKSLAIRKGEKLINQVSKADLPIPDEYAALGQTGATVLTDRREAMLRVVRANFEKGKWGFSDGRARFSAEIADPDFKQKLDSGDIGFYKGDTLRVILAITQVVDPEGQAFQTTYEIEKVLDHIHAPKQQAFLTEQRLPE